MILAWVVAVAALAAAIAAVVLARRTARRLEQLSQMYWELKYQYAELRRQLHPPAAQSQPAEPLPQRSAPADAFVPLASLKR